ncbi:GbsR/MarR family transcriptional regulator [Heyndrickxia acidiproducens]|uniref:GbsR/MarR family transcriptional regulator n=1 Tax=Heyndrickxia acidiproducens TaxID=1121084 RepID=UPI0003815649|nr:hypothetical protein [Heyndrickxia acidiproducens]
MDDDRQKLLKARERVTEAIAQNMNLYGVTPSVGRLYGMMYFHNEPLTLDEMKQELGMSKTSMSTSVRTLVDLKMVEKIWKRGVRKDLYLVEEDWYQTFINFFTIKWRTGVHMNIQAIQRSLQELRELRNKDHLSENLAHEIDIDIEKLNNALDYYDWVDRLIGSFESGEIFKYIPRK